jgi:hypothetical protein
MLGKVVLVLFSFLLHLVLGDKSRFKASAI